MTGWRQRKFRGRGFTLIELVVTIAIAAILMMVAAPSFVTYRQNSQLTAAANTFLAAVNAARAEAMKRQLNAFVRPSNSSWSNGWTSYVDGDWDNQNATAGVDITIGVATALPSNITVSADTTGDATAHYVMFSGSGYLWNATTGAAMIQSTLTLTNGTESRMIVLNASGRTKVCNPAADATCGAAF